MEFEISYLKLTFTFSVLYLLCDKTWTQRRRTDQQVINLVKNTIDQELQEMKLVAEPKTSLVKSAVPVNRFNSVYMLSHFNQEDPKVRKMRNSAYINLATSKRILTASTVPFETYSTDKRVQDGFKAAFNCSGNPPINCRSQRRSRFRTIDGSCNNLMHPRRGMSFTTQKRYLKAEYDDGFDSPRTKSVIPGYKLPSARKVSNAVFRSKKRTKFNSQNTMMLMAWGQFIDHDLTFTPTPSDEGGLAVDCCTETSRDCFPIDIPKNDPHFLKKCMHFIRSSPALENPCVPGPRQQVNQLTAFIDGSQIYGSTKNESDHLRSFKGGKLRVSSHNLPPADKPTVCQRKPGDFCMKGGDKRINEVAHLGAMHIAFLRYHNKIAGKLSRINRHWNDERIFQETRRILGALIQHITYDDYLPKMLSPRDMNKYCLNSAPYCKYDPTINPSIKNVFSTAALRVGHSMVGPIEAYFTSDFRRLENITDIELTMNKPHFVLYNNGKRLPDLMRFVCSSKSAKTDHIIEPGLRNKLFIDEKKDSFDLASLNIQRGRDHGLPSYVKWREFCGLSKVTSFGRLIDHSPDTIKRLRKTYKHPGDIDIFAGGLSEIPVFGSQVGPTFSCILGLQFRDIKLGDRYWYESSNAITGLSSGQIQAIRNVPLSKIICQSMKSNRIQRDIFRVMNYSNLPVRCKSIAELDLSQWRYRRNSRHYYWRPGGNFYYWK